MHQGKAKWATWSTEIECVGPVQVRAGAVKAVDYSLGRFSSAQQGGFREDTRLPRLPNSAYFNGIVVTAEPEHRHD